MMRRNSIVNELVCDIRKFSVYRTANKLISLKETLRSWYIFELIFCKFRFLKMQDSILQPKSV